ncbi:MAG TPA: T9SS type A sorting domain-containing protein [Bacteroidales bacterium]|nr:T9SS type A sorting domain-containing protein [Bacteroidales bacterium]HQH25478.1 T9SS type A sorting domain-containing protein [Bacteroidales bacterium]HQK70174.1 T9SS type A sorting domain-containing protein [Bacteroidales bacterium]
MKINYKRIMKVFNITLVILCLICFEFTIQAQNGIPATGGDASGSGGSASYSVGLPFYTVYAGANGSVVHGVQQPYEISMVTAIEEIIGIDLLFLAYPNPVRDHLTLDVNDSDIANLHFHLYDANGRLLQSRKIQGQQTTIAVGNLIPATYFIKVTSGKKELKTFKIIKN